MCKGFVSSDDTQEDLPIESDMTLRSRRPHTAGSSRPRQTRSLSAPRRSVSVLGPDGQLTDNYQTDPAFAEALWQYYSQQLGKSQRPKTGLQQYRIKEPANRLIRQSGIYRNPSLTRGQKLYLLEKCHIYDTEDSKTRHVNSYLQILSKRLNADLPSYKLGLNDPRDFSTYEKFVKTPRPTARPLNTGYFTSKRPHHPHLPGSHNKHQQFNLHPTSSLNRKDFIVTTNPTVANQKLLKQTTKPQSSRRLSASSVPIQSEKNINIRFRQDTKEITKIPVVSSKSQA